MTFQSDTLQLPTQGDGAGRASAHFRWSQAAARQLVPYSQQHPVLTYVVHNPPRAYKRRRTSYERKAVSVRAQLKNYPAPPPLRSARLAHPVHFPGSVLHILIVPSSDPDAYDLPSGANLTLCTGPWCPFPQSTSSPVLMECAWTHMSVPPATKTSFLMQTLALSTSYPIVRFHTGVNVMASKNANPAILVRQAKLPDGSISDMPVLTNLFASRELSAKAMGIDDHRNSARAMAGLTSKAIDPVTVDAAIAPVREIVEEGDAADLQILPALRQHDGDAGHYVTCGHVVTYDPDTGIDNMGIQRLWVRGARLMGCYMLETSHNMLNLRKFWARNEPCPVAIWVGHHPAIEMGAQSKLGYPESHWGVAGGALGEASLPWRRCTATKY